MHSFWNSVTPTKFRAPVRFIRYLAFGIVIIVILPELNTPRSEILTFTHSIQILMCLSAICSAILLLFRISQSVWIYWLVLVLGSLPSLDNTETALNIALLYGGVITYSASLKQNLVTFLMLLVFYIPRSWSNSLFDVIFAVVLGLSISFIFPLIIRFMVNQQILQESLHRHHVEEGNQKLEHNRKELARELHDVVARELTIIALHSSMARDSTDENLRNETFDLIGNQSRSTLNELRRLVTTLRSDTGPIEAPQLYGTNIDFRNVTAEIEHHFQSAQFPCEIEIEGEPSRIPDSIKPTVEKSLKELAINIVKHGNPQMPAKLSLVVTDINTEIHSNNLVQTGKPSREYLGMGYGLEGLRERVKLLGGTFHASSARHHWITTISLPFV